MILRPLLLSLAVLAAPAARAQSAEVNLVIDGMQITLHASQIARPRQEPVDPMGAVSGSFDDGGLQNVFLPPYQPAPAPQTGGMAYWIPRR